MSVFRLWFYRRLMVLAWTIDEYADGFVSWTQQKYSDEIYGIGTID